MSSTSQAPRGVRDMRRECSLLRHYVLYSARTGLYRAAVAALLAGPYSKVLGKVWIRTRTFGARCCGLDRYDKLPVLWR